MKTGKYLKLKLRVRENKKIGETVFDCLSGAQVESFKQKNIENLVTLSL